MKSVFCLAVAVSGVAATKPSYALGQALGEAVSAGISNDPDFAAKLAPALGAKKSFLSRPMLNLHVGETAGASLSADRAAIASSLGAVEQGEVDLLSKIAGGRGSFLQSSISDLQRLGAEAAGFTDALMYYIKQVNAGGSTGRRGLVGLMQLAALPNSRVPMQMALFPVSQLAKRESTSDATRNLAGSLIAFLTNLPYSVQSSDVASGSYGHTNIVLPSPSRIYGAEMTIAELKAGAHAADTAAGSLY